jgi:myosin heavy subunit
VEAAIALQTPKPDESLAECLQPFSAQEVNAEHFQDIALHCKEELANNRQVNARLSDETLHFQQELARQLQLNEQNSAEAAVQLEISAKLFDEVLHCQRELTCQQEWKEQNMALQAELANRTELNAMLFDQAAIYRNSEMQSIEELKTGLRESEQVIQKNQQEEEALQQEVKRCSWMHFSTLTDERMAELKAASLEEQSQSLSKYVNEVQSQNQALLRQADARKIMMTSLESEIEARDQRLQVTLQEYCALQTTLQNQVVKEMKDQEEQLNQEVNQYAGLLRNSNAALRRAEKEAAHVENHCEALTKYAHDVCATNRVLVDQVDAAKIALANLEQKMQAKDQRMGDIWQEKDVLEFTLKAQEKMNQQMQYLARHELMKLEEKRMELLDELHTCNLMAKPVMSDFEVQTNEMDFLKGDYKAPPPKKPDPLNMQATSSPPVLSGPSSSSSSHRRAQPPPRAKPLEQA